jgi:hypothetical protein
MHTKFPLDSLKEKDNSEERRRKKGIICGLDSSGSEKEPVAGSCEHDNESSGSIKRREFLD